MVASDTDRLKPLATTYMLQIIDHIDPYVIVKIRARAKHVSCINAAALRLEREL
jgi:hypothetical protein